MVKNVIIIILVILCAGEAVYILHKRTERPIMMQGTAMKTTNRPTMPSSRRPMFVMKGSKFSDNPLFSKAYLIAPVAGDLSSDAKKALTGWDVKTTNNADGSMQVNLVPQETEDVQQQFSVKQGYKLYFIEMTLADDSSTQGDMNRADDIGVLVDQNDIVQ